MSNTGGIMEQNRELMKRSISEAYLAGRADM